MSRISTCSVCQAPFTQAAGRGRPRKYCSDCRDRSYYEPVVTKPANCAVCGATFEQSHGRQFCGAECQRARSRETDRARERDWSHKKRCPCSNCGELTWGGPLDVVTCHPCRRLLGPPVHDLEVLAELHASEATAPAPGERPTRAQLGLGNRHQQAVKTLRRLHHDGDPCFWCGRPMWLDATKNFDYDPASGRRGSGSLHGDHIIARSRCLANGIPVPLPDRLLHGECNIQRGAGLNDHLAWGVRG